MDQVTAMRKLCEAIFGRNNLIGTDFADVNVRRVDREFEQDRAGVRIQFTVSNHALGKLSVDESGEVYDALGLSD